MWLFHSVNYLSLIKESKNSNLNFVSLDGSPVCLMSACVRTAGRMLATMNRSADPCVNFYEFACGGFSAKQEISVGKKMTSQFTKQDAQVLKQLKKTIERPFDNKDPIVTKVRNYYRSCQNIAMTELRGLPRLRTMVNELGGFHFSSSDNMDQWNLEGAFEKISRYSLNGLVKVGVSPDFFDTSRNILYLDRGTLGLGPDTRTFYINKSINVDPVLNAYTEMLHTYAQLILGEAQSVSKNDIMKIVTFEKKLAEIQSNDAYRRNVEKLYKEVKLDVVYESAPLVHWDRYLTGLFKASGNDQITINHDETVVVLDWAYFSNLTNLVESYTKSLEGKKVVQNYLVLLAMLPYAPRMGSRFKSAYTKFVTVYTGNRGSPEPWLDCLGDTSDKLGFPLGKMYIDRYSPDGHKEKALIIAKSVKHAYHGLIADATWMDEHTRAKALEKLDAIDIDLAYPKWIKNSTYILNKFLDFEIIYNDYPANLFAYHSQAMKHALHGYLERPDAQKWTLTPQTVNGRYETSQNKLMVSAALLFEPFFHVFDGVPDVVNFGSFGVLAGHEIAHAFDDRGQSFDQTGSLRNWWTMKTLATYRNHTQCFVKQYSAYTIDGNRIDGGRTLSENLADNSGVRSAFRAFKDAEKHGLLNSKARLPGLDYNTDQLFYLSFAQTYCTLLTKEALRNQVSAARYAPSAVRVIGTLANNDDFAKAFQCHDQISTMNRRNKCYLW